MQTDQFVLQNFRLKFIKLFYKIKHSRLKREFQILKDIVHGLKAAIL